MPKQLYILIAIFGLSQLSQAQDEEQDDIGTETVTVTKAYAPTISDALNWVYGNRHIEKLSI